MITALLLAKQVWDEERRKLFTAASELCAQSAVTGFLLRAWLSVVVRGLRRAHTTLARGVDLSHLATGHGVLAELAEVTAYLSVFGSSGQRRPGRQSTMRLLDHHVKRSNQFLVGTPSQYRKQHEPLRS